MFWGARTGPIAPHSYHPYCHPSATPASTPSTQQESAQLSSAQARPTTAQPSSAQLSCVSYSIFAQRKTCINSSAHCSPCCPGSWLQTGAPQRAWLPHSAAEHALPPQGPAGSTNHTGTHSEGATQEKATQRGLRDFPTPSDTHTHAPPSTGLAPHPQTHSLTVLSGANPVHIDCPHSD